MEKFDSEALDLLKVNRPTQSTKIQRLLIYLFIATSTIYYSLNNNKEKINKKNSYEETIFIKATNNFISTL